MFEFTIAEIKCGWFEAEIKDGNKTANITNSDYLGNDAPAILLRNLNELSAVNSGTRWLCWNDEPNAYIWSLRKDKDVIYYQITSALKNSDHLDYEGTELKDEKTKYILIDGKTMFRNMLKSVAAAMKKYSLDEYLEIYQSEWCKGYGFEFPFTELKRAEEFLRQYAKKYEE